MLDNVNLQKMILDCCERIDDLESHCQQLINALAVERATIRELQKYVSQQSGSYSINAECGQVGSR